MASSRLKTSEHIKDLYQGLTPVPSDFWGAPVFVAQNKNEGGSGVNPGEQWCPGYSGATYSKRVADYVYIQVPFDNGQLPQTPGICEVRVTKGRAVDKKKRAGGDGSRITLHGLQPAEGEIRVRIWTPQQWENIKVLWSIVFPGPQKVTSSTTSYAQVSSTTPTTTTATISGGQVNNITTIPQSTPKTITKSTVTSLKDVTVPFDITHPSLSQLGVKSVIFVGAEGITDGRVKGEKVFVMKWVEFFLPTSASTTNSPTGAQAIGSVLDSGGQFAPPGTNPANTGPSARAPRLGS